MSILGCFYIFFVIILCLNCLSYIFVVISASSVSFNICHFVFSVQWFIIVSFISSYFMSLRFFLNLISVIWLLSVDSLCLLLVHLCFSPAVCHLCFCGSMSFFVILNLTEIIFFSYVISYLILVVLCLCLFSFPVVFMCLCSIFSFMSCQSFFASLCLSFCSFIFVVFCFFLVVLSFSLQFLKKL